MQKYEQEQIEKLIKKGYDLKLISFELEIEMKDLEKIKAKLESQKPLNASQSKLPESPQKIEENNCTTNNVTSKRTNNTNEKVGLAHRRMQHMRGKYRSILGARNNTSLKEDLQTRSTKKIDSAIAFIEKTIQEMSGITDKKQRKKFAYSILSKLNDIQNEELTISQAEKLRELMYSKELKNLRLGDKDPVEININKARKRAEAVLADAISLKISEVNDLEELESLAQKLNQEFKDSNLSKVREVKSKLIERKAKLQQEMAIKRIRNNTPANIEQIITSIANGTLDIKKANEIIDEEARKRTEEKPHNRFSLTEEQQRGQILIQIKIALRERVEEFPVSNPETAICQIQELCGGDSETILGIVVQNLVAQKQYEEAKKLLTEITTAKDKEEPAFKRMYKMREQIIYAQLGEMISKHLEASDLTPQQELNFIETIEKELRSKNIKLNSIPLGTSYNGLKKITLEDVWVEEKQR